MRGSDLPGQRCRIVLGAFWLLSGLILFLPSSFSAAQAIAEVAGIKAPVSEPLIFAGALIDIALGLPMLVGVRVRVVAILQAVVAAGYVAVLGALLPGLWTDPLGALIKPLPLIVAALLVAAMAEDR